MADQDSSCSHYALLIGIDAYAEKPLKGCVRDVHAIKTHLDGIPAPGVQTHILTASLAKQATSTHLIENAKDWPTHGNVVNMLEQITAKAKEGNFVYIHFSGHGTAFRNPYSSSSTRAFSNPSTGDLALNLLQDDGSRTCYLRGSDLACLLRDMVEKKLVVTLVLDCCFSGSVMRNDASVRYLDYNPLIDATHLQNSRQALNSVEEIGNSVYRSVSLRPNWLLNPDGYTVIAACGPTEVAKEIQVNGLVHGALSYFLSDTFERFGGIGGKQQHIYQVMRARFRETREKYRHSQNPMLYGNKDLDFFGRANTRVGPVPVLVNKNQNGSFNLEAGQLHGICKGDKFTVYAIANRSAPGEVVQKGDLVTAEVTSVGALTSDLMLPGSTVIGDELLAATALTNLSLQRFPTRLDLRAPYPEGWAEALGKQRSLRIYDVHDENQECRPSFTVAMLERSVYEIRDEMDRTLLCLPTSSVDSNGAAMVLNIIEHFAKFELAKTLTDESLACSTSRFRSSFSVRLIKQSGEAIDPGCLKTGIYELCSHSECLVKVEEGTSLQLEVKNNEGKGGYAFCLHVYNIGSSWEVENILHGGYEVIPPSSSNQNEQFRKGSNGVWNKTLKAKVPQEVREKGQNHCDDILRIILTSQPTSFSLLELPELGESMGIHLPSQHRRTDSYSSSEDCVSLSFRIRTRIKI